LYKLNILVYNEWKVLSVCILGLELNAEKKRYMFMSLLPNAGQKHDFSKANSPLKLLQSSTTWKPRY